MYPETTLYIPMTRTIIWNFVNILVAVRSSSLFPRSGEIASGVENDSHGGLICSRR
jgi:hypothetical protein